MAKGRSLRVALARPDVGELRAEALDRVTAATLALVASEAEYRSALLAARGFGCTLAAIGGAAGISAQAVHDLQHRERRARRAELKAEREARREAEGRSA